jgi:uncharacterized protein YihD (DUF1040 family)
MALGKIFDLIGDTIIPNEHCSLMAPLVRVKEEYSKDYLKIIAFLHYMNSMNPLDNPYADVDLGKRADIILFNMKLNIDVENQTIKDALHCVEEIYCTSFYKAYKGYKAMFDRISDKMLTTELDLDKDGNAAVIKGFFKDYESIRKSFKIAFKDFEEEQGSGKTRGGGELAEDEDQDY